MMRKLYSYLTSNSGVYSKYNLLSRLVGLIYFIAIAPLYFQILALIGENGLQPAKQLLYIAFANEGACSFIHFPSLFWLWHHDSTLLALVVIGAFAAIFLMINFFPLTNAIIAWLCFTSLCAIGGDFLVIIIDLFLSEVGFLLILLHFSKRYFGYIPKIIHFSFIFLNFRLWFSMGMVKFYFPGTTWTDLSFFEYFFPNQPMPTPLAYYFWRLPHWTHILAEIWLVISQLIIPFFVFGNKNTKIIAFLSFLVTSILIMLSGNYGYFNILSIVISVVLIEERFKSVQNTKSLLARSQHIKQKMVVAFAGILLFMQFSYTLALFDPKPPCYQNHFNQIFLYEKFQKFPYNIISTILKPLVYSRVSNPYGVFKGIPKFRIELRFSGSYDSIHWAPYVFKYVPSANIQTLKWFAPYYPRLDHLLFYETIDAGGYNFNLLNPYYKRNNVWTANFLRKLFLNDKDVVSLLKYNPFKQHPPVFIRCEAYSLSFNKIGDGRNIWSEKILITPFLGRMDEISDMPLMKSGYIYGRFPI